MKITLPIYHTFERKTKKDKRVLVGLNWYRNAHHFYTNAVKKHYHELVADLKLKKLTPPISIIFTVYIKRRGTDFHNIRSVVEKFFLDGLVKSGVIPDDSGEYIKEIHTYHGIDKDNPRIEIEIK